MGKEKKLGPRMEGTVKELCQEMERGYDDDLRDSLDRR